MGRVTVARDREGATCGALFSLVPPVAHTQMRSLRNKGGGG